MTPLYRAKRIDSDEWVEGYLIGDVCHQADNGEATYTQQIIEVGCAEVSEINWSGEIWVSGDAIDTNTLAIHFPNMIDKNGKKIFASLNEDGVGGDELYHEDGCEVFVAEYTTRGMRLYEYLDNKVIKNAVAMYRQSFDFEVTGIHKGE